ncbi:MAG: amidohydrolase family protein [Phycisphaerales bacterium]|nr:amidohydrolase family protein [Phycisphaerales bacterium]
MVRLLKACGAVTLLAAFAAPAAAQDKAVAVVGARVIPISGAPIDDGVLLVKDGKIIAAGPAASVQVPADAITIDARGKVVMPGLVDTHSHIGGIGGADGSAPLQPSVRIYDSLNSNDSGFKRAQAGGLTTLNVMPGSGHLLSGQTVYVKARNARTIEGMMLRDERLASGVAGGLKMANGTNPMRDAPFPGTRGKSAALVRELFVRAQDYRQKTAQAAADDPKRPARDLGLDALSEVLDGKRIVHHHTHRADDIATVLRMQKEFGFRVVLHHVSEAWKVAGEIKAAQDAGGVLGCSVILVDSPGGKLEAAEIRYDTGAILEKAGVRTAFHTDDWITDSRVFLRMAALAVRAGMSREAALRALTLSGAEMLDLQSRVGSLEAGKDADFIVLSGDPLSVYTKVEQTWVDGVKVFDRSDPKDRLYATGGLGAGHDQSPYFCCFGSDAAGGWAWRFGGNAAGNSEAAP